MTYNYITTYTGKSFEFMNPKPEQIDIHDIAQALSMNCRFNGHVKKFYSVAEHSVLMARYCMAEFNSLEMAYDALMHDASEAYICDIPRPIKPHLHNYREIEQGIECALQDKFQFCPMSETIKDIDNRIVSDEAEQLFKVVPDWVKDYKKVGITVHGWKPAKARHEFLNLFALLAFGLDLTV